LFFYPKESNDSERLFFDGFELYLKSGHTCFQKANQGLFGLKKVIQVLSRLPQLSDIYEKK